MPQAAQYLAMTVSFSQVELLLFRYIYSKLIELSFIDRCRGFADQTLGILVLREGHDFSYGRLTQKEHYQSVKALTQASVRRCSVFESFDEEAKLFFTFFLCQPQYVEHLGLEFPVVYPD